MSSGRASWGHAQILVALLGCAWSAGGCAEDPNGGPSLPPPADGGVSPDVSDTSDGADFPDGPVVPVGPPMKGLHIVDNRIVNADGMDVRLRGVNRSGSEYQCLKPAGIFDGPATLASIRVMAAWKINAVRIPLNETCWLGINGVKSGQSGAAYKQAIVAYVGLFHQFNIVPILDLHWVGPGTTVADRLQPMPDADHAAAFWADVATTFADDDGVIFELFNEPFPDGNRDSPAGWLCWRDGCMVRQSVASGQPAAMFQAIGMQGLVDAVRMTGSRHLLLAGGLQYSNALSGWKAHAPVDPLANTAAAWHVYNFNACGNAGCWDGVPAALAATTPIVMTEFGENSCGGAFIRPLLRWGDTHGVGYLAWTWNTWGTCVPPTPPATQGGKPWALIGDFATGAPNGGYAQAYHDHLQGL
ncbi:MAG: cellulase family glycosylhydrolase [Pseudomonadota bacterium]